MKRRFIITACLALLFALAGCQSRGEVGFTIGSHRLIIINTSGKAPYGGTAGTSVAADGTETHFFKSANGEFDITLKGNVLTINGDKYILKGEKDTIQLEDGKVLINGTPAKPVAAP